jgi:acyl-CoA thioesterase-1
MMRICFIGDSFVNGTGDDDCLGWAGRICANARYRGRDITFYNLGIRRDTSADIAERWQREAKARLAPEHDGRLVFSFGVNDCVFDKPNQPRLSETVSLANARFILDSAKAWLPTLMIGSPPTSDTTLNERVKRLSDRLHAVCDDLSVPFLSPWDQLMASDIWLREVALGDGAHPNRGGYARLAALIETWRPWRSWVDPVTDAGQPSRHPVPVRSS